MVGVQGCSLRSRGAGTIAPWGWLRRGAGFAVGLASPWGWANARGAGAIAPWIFLVIWS